MDRLEVAAAVGITGASVFAIHGIYTQHAGTLSDARSAPAGDPETRQRLSDADILTGALALVVGGTLTAVTRRPEPIALAVVALAVVAVYYHAACESQNVETSDGVPSDDSQPSGYVSADPTLDVGEGVTSDYTTTADDEHATVY